MSRMGCLALGLFLLHVMIADPVIAADSNEANPGQWVSADRSETSAAPIDLNVLAANRRRLRLAATALDVTQAQIQAKVGDLLRLQEASRVQLAAIHVEVRQKRARAAQSVGLQMADALAGPDRRRFALRRVLLATHERAWLEAEDRLLRAGETQTLLRTEQDHVRQLLIQLDDAVGAVAQRHTEFDDAPIAAVARATVGDEVDRHSVAWPISPAGLGAEESVQLPGSNASNANEQAVLVWPATAEANTVAVTLNSPVPPIGAPLGWTSLPWSSRLLDSAIDPESRTEHGVGIRIMPGERIGAPESGTIVFAGPFRAYGLILIIDHGNGYHTLMAGFSRLDVKLGMAVQSGDSLGRLDDASSTAGRLYVEVRHLGVPVDPMPWLAAREDKVRG
jgi:murein DD-endopeptidase MepM/ murein hydrolase activator NlpD